MKLPNFLVSVVVFLVTGIVCVACHFYEDDVAKVLHIDELGITRTLGVFVVQAIAFALSCLALYAMWAGDLRRRHAAKVGAVICLCLLFGVFSAISVASTAYHLSLFQELERASNEFVDFEIEADAASGTIYLFGDIGVGVTDEFGRVLAEMGTAERLEIDSPGGVVSEAMALAELVEDSGMTVIARGACDSACILVAVASRNSFAETGLSFGFHSVYPVLDRDEQVVTFATDAERKRARDFLAAHRVPVSILDKASRIGPTEPLLYVPADELVASGALKGLLPAGTDDPPADSGSVPDLGG